MGKYNGVPLEAIDSKGLFKNWCIYFIYVVLMWYDDNKWSVAHFSIGSGNCLSPVCRQAITWTNADFLSIGLLGANISKF